VAFTFEFTEDGVRRWETAPEGRAEPTLDDGYEPTLAVAGDPARLDALDLRLRRDPKVTGTRFEEGCTSLAARRRDDPEPVLRVAVARVGEVRNVAGEIRGLYERGTLAPGSLRLYGVDLSPGFRYCLDRGLDPTPARDLRTLTLDLPERALGRRDASRLRVAGERAGRTERACLRALAARLAADDPDALVVSRGEVVPVLAARADALGVDLSLGRLPGWRMLAGRSSHASYGRVVHAAPRYDVPGRVVVDRANSFLYGKCGLPGLLYLVRQSRKPLQEVGWASIGTVLTAIQTREALDRRVLVPWNKWNPESFKTVAELHAADRGGVTFAPEPGVYRNVVEVDFSSLYPRIICERNVSPETVGCDCHADRADVPGLDYAVCDEPGFLPDVLGPLVRDREKFKAEDSPESAAKADAIKWILVSCFGYQGYRNAKFGRIECHETINAYAREILLDAKEAFEAAGWRVVHGIVDSLWVTPADGDEGCPVPVERVCKRVSESVGIPLEFERRYDWFALVPRRSAPGGALDRYFGLADGEFKIRGIECRQRSTPAFVADAQRAMLDALAADRRPEAACRVCEKWREALRDGRTDPAALVVRRRVTRALDDYDRATRAAAALERAQALDHDVHPGQDVRFVVRDDDAVRQHNRVRLAFEDVDAREADVEFYEELLVRAAESVVSPFGWQESDVRGWLDGEDASLSRWV
jgi:DNA polymerase I